MEQEADRVADDLTRAASEGPGRGRGLPDIDSPSATPVSRGGTGRPLPDPVRSFFEAGLGHDFSDVRVYADERADAAARTIGARAFTKGGDIVFRRGAYDDRTQSGRHLLAHELTHVIQQRSAGLGRRAVQRVPELLDPWATDMERELTRLTDFQRGHADHGRSELLNPWPETDAPAIEQEIVAFTRRFLPSAAQVDRDRLADLLRAFLPAATTSRQDGFDAMAAVIAQHSGGGQPDWPLSQSSDLMQLLHDIGYWKDFDRRVVEAAEREYGAWTDMQDPGRRQFSESATTGGTPRQLGRLESYWRSAGRSPAYASTSAQQSAQDAAAYPWSAAFISHVMRVAGAGDTFRYDSAHATYAVAARDNAVGNASAVTHPSRLFNAVPTQAPGPGGQQVIRPGEPVHIGGLIHRNRAGGTPNRTFGNIALGNQSHADVVVDIQVFNDSGARVPGRHEDILRVTPANVLNTFRIFAVTIGGNTVDQTLDANLAIQDRTRSGSVAGRDNETVGRRFWRLNPDLTVDNTQIPGREVYGIQRWTTPP